QLSDAWWVWWVSPILGTIIYVWGGQPFLTGAVSEIRARQPGMMLLIGLAITVAFLASWGATLGILDHELNFWWELALDRKSTRLNSSHVSISYAVFC